MEQSFLGMRQLILPVLLAIQQCVAVSQADPELFTRDVQDYHEKRIALLRDALIRLTADPAPSPVQTGSLDGYRGRLVASYAKTAEATTRMAANLHDNEQVQRLADQSGKAASSAASSAKVMLQSLSEKISNTRKG